MTNADNSDQLYSQQELDAKLLAAANALRGPIDPADFKAYIFPLLFLKRISDTWKWEHEQALERFDGDEELAALPENHRFVVPEGCLWDDVLALPENVGAGLQLVFDRLQEANPNSLAGVFGTVQWGNKDVLPEERLVACLDVFTTLKLDPDSVSHDLLGNAYEYLLKNFADESGKKAGEFFTPRAVVRLMVQLLDPQEGESIYDPTCGSGGMLVESVNQVRAHGQDPRTLRLYGQEVAGTTAAIARMNLFLHDIETFSIKTGDTLRKPRFRDDQGDLEKFDVVIANPPFSLKNWGRDAWSEDPYGRSAWGVPPKNNADFAFVEHMLASVVPDTGRLAVVVPHGVLFRGGGEADIRRQMVQNGFVKAVIGLPGNLFYNTTIPAAILVCRAEAPSGAEPAPVLFIDASACFEKRKNQNAMRASDVSAVADAYKTCEDPDGDFGVSLRLVGIEEIADNNWDLSLSRYVDIRTTDALDLSDALTEFRQSSASVKLAEEELDERLREAGIDG